MNNVKDILTQKGFHIERVSPHTSVIEALQHMAEKKIGSVVVMDEGNFMGIMTERDYSRKVILRGKNSTDTHVSDIMSTDLPRVSPSDSIAYCMTLMTEQHIRYLPVFDNNQLTGIISMTDVVSATILRQQNTIAQLENYITRS